MSLKQDKSQVFLLIKQLNIEKMVTMNLAILAFFRDFQRFTSRLHTLGPWVKFLISVVGIVLHTFKSIKFD